MTLMLDLRSATLRPIEGSGTPRLKELLRRWAAAGLALAAVATAIWAVDTRALDAQGPGRLLYALHDHVYLPLKGYLWQWAYPWSLALWIPLFFLALAWAAFFLSGRSLASSLQTRLLSWMLDRPALRRLLMRTARTGLPAGLLREAVASKLRVSKFALQSRPTSALAALNAELASMNGDPEVHLEAATEWAEALAVAELDRSAGRDASKPQGLTSIRAEGPREAVLQQAFQWLSLPSDEDEKAQGQPFSWTAMARDLRDAGAPEGAFPGGEAGLPGETLRGIRLNRLGQSVERRRRLLEEELRRLELERREGRLALMARRQRPLKLPVAQLPASGRLAAAMAVLYAVQSRQPGIALLWIDLLEGLHLALGLAPSQTHGEYALLVRDLPSALHYRLASALARRRLDSRQSDWRAQSYRSDQLLTGADFTPSRSRVASLQLASGQD